MNLRALAVPLLLVASAGLGTGCACRPCGLGPAPAPATATLQGVAPIENPAQAEIAPADGFAAFVATLRAAAESGADADLAGHADLLAAIGALVAGPASEAPVILRAPALEAAARAAAGRGIAFASVSSYFEPEAPPDAMRAAYLDFDRQPAWTGRSGARVEGRDGAAILGFADGMRSGPFGVRYGARWKFRALPIDRGPARLAVSRFLEDPRNRGMVSSRGILVAFPERGGTRLVEAATSALDVSAPSFLRGVAMSQAMRELRERAQALRAHWRDYAR